MSARPPACVHLVAAFTKGGDGGNLAGVVLEAQGLSRTDRQHVAAVVNVSETAFVRRVDETVFEVEFFTPTSQVPDCGHATVATFALLASRGALTSGITIKRTIVGDREITIEGERVFMQQPRPSLTAFGKTAEVAAALGIAPDAITEEPVVGDNAMRFVLVRVSSCEVLSAIVPDHDAISALSALADAVGFYLAAPGERGEDASARMFAPRFGILEESATGTAAGSLGGLLARGRERAAYRFVQGAHMATPAPSELIVRVEPDRVLVGGSANVLRTMEVDLL